MPGHAHALPVRPALTLAILLLWMAPVSGQTLLLMPESTGDTVQSFDPTTGAHLGVVIPPDPIHLSTPVDCDLHATGFLVSDQIQDAVQHYDPVGVWTATFASPIDNLRGIAVHGGVLYCTAGNVSAIPMFDATTGAALGDFIPPGGGGLNSPFDILFRRSGDVLVTSINSDNILQYTLAGVYVGIFATNIPFGEQMFEAANDNVLVADFTRNEVVELSPVGVELTALSGVSGPRGVYELPGGDLLVTNSSGVHVMDRVAGGILVTQLAGVAGRYLQLVNLGLACTLTAPPGPASGDVPIPVSSSSPVASSVDLTFSYSLDGGATWTTCTAAASSALANPAVAVPTGSDTFTWDTVADGVGLLSLQVGVLVEALTDDGTTTATCRTAPFDVDNVQVPTCNVLAPAGGTVTGAVTVDLDAASASSPTVDILLEFSLDGGATWQICGVTPTSPLPNPATGVATGASTLLWDSRADGVGLASIQVGVLLQITVDDGVVAPVGTCTSAPFDVDNQALCPGPCGDCNLGGSGPDIIDALTGAQIAAGLLTPSTTQDGCCDVDSSGAITVTDALRMAQGAAGLPVTLTCP